MGFNVASRFQIADENWFDDPLETGYRFKIKRLGKTKYPDILSKKQKPLVDELQRRAYKAGMVRSVTSQKKGKRGGSSLSEKELAEIIIRDMDTKDLDKIEMMHDPEDIRKHLLLDWSNVTDENGTEIEFSEENVRDLMSLDLPIPEDVLVAVDDEGEPEYVIEAETPLGRYYTNLFFFWSSQNDHFRDEYLKEVRGNF